jgi:cobalt transporter subunit CbtB
MTTTTNTVRERFNNVQASLTTTQLAAGLLLIAAIGSTMLFLQEPLVHDSLHNFRHAAGITCH